LWSATTFPSRVICGEAAQQDATANQNAIAMADDGDRAGFIGFQ
jgi:hypothetical protein